MRKRRTNSWDKTFPLKWTWGWKPAKNSSNHHPSLNPIKCLKWVKVFSVKLLVNMSAVFSVDGKYYKEITMSCTKPWMWCICIYICFVFFLWTRSLYILMEIWLSTQMLVGESNATPNSWRIPCNQTHGVAAFTAPLYSAYVEEREIVCCLLLEQKIGPSASMKTKTEVDFLSMGSPAQSE